MSGDDPGVAIVGIVQWMRREPAKPTCTELTATPQSQQGHARQGGSAGRMTSRAKYCLFTLVAKVTSHGRILVRFCASDLQNMLDNRGCGQLHNTIHGTSHALSNT